ncbi:MAG: hypothetical protein M1536_05275 [Firmicutes bacterium]|nr:hypothetical protein [Bacillota bacterium]
MEDLREQIRAQENALERIMRYIPGFSGYKDREQRRNADKIQRDYLAKLLEGERTRLQEVSLPLIRYGRLDDLNELDRAGSKLEKITDRIRHADYGYSGFFDSIKIGEQELDKLYEHDLTLISGVDSIKEAILAVNAAIEQNQELLSLTKSLEEKIDAFNDCIDEREKLVPGVS